MPAVFFPADTHLVPEHVEIPTAVQSAAEDARDKFARMSAIGAELRALRERVEESPREDRENARKAAAVGDSPPASIEKALRESYGELEREYGGTAVVVCEALAAQAREIAKVKESWTASVRERIHARADAIREQLLMVADEFAQLADDTALLDSLAAFEGTPQTWNARPFDPEREQRQRERTRRQIRDSRASIQREPIALLAALELLAEQAGGTPPAKPEPVPVEQSAAGYPQSASVGGETAAW